ncbi:MAG TPA: hypothetical protein DCZ12_02380 [Gammaproteobacteria bacterium]|nr:hypothetical protein [Gammaproteobacteria bacterium]
MSLNHFCDRERLHEAFAGKSVAIVGSGPGVLKNDPGFVDSHDVVVRVNNYKTSAQAGKRTDVFYSYFGNAVKKTARELKADGVTLCISKLPNGKVVDSPWHEKRKKLHGIDYRWVYEKRRNWWFCDTFVPSVDDLREKMSILDGHMPTTGFAAISDVLSCAPRYVYLTGFDFFQSMTHNVNEAWKPGDPTDPIGHDAELERIWIRDNCARLPIGMDEQMIQAMKCQVAPDQHLVRAALNRQESIRIRNERLRLRRRGLS